MDKHIIVSDLDGTLFTTNKTISSPSHRWISNWIKKGGVFFIATGRHYNNVKHFFADWRERPLLITSNGAMYEEKITFPEDQVLIAELPTLISIAKAKNIHVSVFTCQGWFVSEVNKMVREHDFHAHVVSLTQMKTLPAFKILFNAGHEQLKSLNDQLKCLNGDYHLCFTDDFVLELQKKGINKYSALQSVLQKNKLETKEIIAFGDGMNDVELLSESNFGVLMGNSHRSLKEILPGSPVTLSNDDDGVVHYLENHFK